MSKPFPASATSPRKAFWSGRAQAASPNLLKRACFRPFSAASVHQYQSLKPFLSPLFGPASTSSCPVPFGQGPAVGQHQPQNLFRALSQRQQHHRRCRLAKYRQRASICSISPKTFFAPAVWASKSIVPDEQASISNITPGFRQHQPQNLFRPYAFNAFLAKARQRASISPKAFCRPCALGQHQQHHPRCPLARARQQTSISSISPQTFCRPCALGQHQQHHPRCLSAKARQKDQHQQHQLLNRFCPYSTGPASLAASSMLFTQGSPASIASSPMPFSQDPAADQHQQHQTQRFLSPPAVWASISSIIPDAFQPRPGRRASISSISPKTFFACALTQLLP